MCIDSFILTHYWTDIGIFSVNHSKFSGNWHHWWNFSTQHKSTITWVLLLWPLLQVSIYILHRIFVKIYFKDRIAAVRNNGVEILAEVLALFIREEWPTKSNESSPGTVHSATLPFTDKLLNEIRAGFSQSRNWRRRQRYFGSRLKWNVKNFRHVLI